MMDGRARGWTAPVSMPSAMLPKPDGSMPSGAYPRIAWPACMPIKSLCSTNWRTMASRCCSTTRHLLPMIRKPSCSLRCRA